MSDPQSERPWIGFLRALAQVAGSLALIVAPMALAAALPLRLGLASEAALAVAVLVLRLAGARRWLRWVTNWAWWATFGLGYATWRVLPGGWGIAAGVALVLFGTIAFNQLEGAPRLASPLGGKRGEGEPDAFYARLQTPEGQPIRLLDEEESARMGGSLMRTLLFDDGVLLQDVGQVGRFSRDRRYFAAVLPHPYERDDGLLVLDRVDRTVRYDNDSDRFWRLPEFAPAPVIEPPRRAWHEKPLTLQRFLDTHPAQALVSFQDLWIIPSDWSRQSEAWTTTRSYPSPDGRHEVVARPLAPKAFLPLADPLDRLLYPRHALVLDGRDSGLVTLRHESGAWREDSAAFVCRAARAEALATAADTWDAAQRFWCWTKKGGWQLAPDIEHFAPHDVARTNADAALLDGLDLQLESKLATPLLEHGRYGRYISWRDDTLEVPAGAEADGVYRPRPLLPRRARLAVPLPGAAVPAADAKKRVISRAPDGAAEAVFIWDHESAAGLSAWRCRIGGWALPGLWLFDHRWMEQGAGLALCRFAEALPFADKVVLALPERLELKPGPDMLIAGLHDAFDGAVAVIELAGRMSATHDESAGTGFGPQVESVLGTLLAPFDQPAPAPDQAAAFLAGPEEGNFYRLLRLRAEGGVLAPQPAWRVVSQAQACNAEGDFVYPAPGNGIRNAAWYFGAHALDSDGWPDREEPRRSGFLLTAHGFALADVAPAMIWSEDGTLLALCRRDRDAQWRWRLLLLDQRHGRLYADAELLPMGVPCFQRFDREGLAFTCKRHPWMSDSRPLELPRLRTLPELQAMPEVTLTAGTGLRLELAQAGNVRWWEALDSAPLAPYRPPR